MSFPEGPPVGGTEPFAPPPPPSLPTPAKHSKRGRNIAIGAAVVLAIGVAGLGARSLSLSNDLDDRKSTIDSLRDDNDDLDGRISALEDDKASAADDLDAANETIDSITDEVSSLETELDTTKADLSAAVAEVTDLQAQLEEATSTTTTTAPPDTVAPETTTAPADPADPQNDGVIDAVELGYVQQAINGALPSLTVEQAQTIAGQACASTSADELTAVVLITQLGYWPDGDPVQAATLVGAIAGTTCLTHITSLTGTG